MCLVWHFIVEWKRIATLPSVVLGWAVTLPRVRFLSEAINIETVGRNGDFSWPQAELPKVTRLADSDRTTPLRLNDSKRQISQTHKSQQTAKIWTQAL